MTSIATHEPRLIETHGDRLETSCDRPQIPVNLPPIPAETLDAIGAEITRMLKPAGRQAGMDMAEELIDLFPNIRARNPKRYSHAVAMLFAAAPEWAGRKAVMRLFHTCRFPPTGADIADALDHAMRDINRRRRGLQKEREHASTYRPPRPPPSQKEIKTISDIAAKYRARVADSGPSEPPPIKHDPNAAKRKAQRDAEAQERWEEWQKEQRNATAQPAATPQAGIQTHGQDESGGGVNIAASGFRGMDGS